MKAVDVSEGERERDRNDHSCNDRTNLLNNQMM